MVRTDLLIMGNRILRLSCRAASGNRRKGAVVEQNVTEHTTQTERLLHIASFAVSLRSVYVHAVGVHHEALTASPVARHLGPLI